jgi:hypothetical protein
LEVIINFCLSVDQENAESCKAWKKLVTHDMTDKELAEARGSAD